MEVYSSNADARGKLKDNIRYPWLLNRSFEKDTKSKRSSSKYCDLTSWYYTYKIACF